MWCRRAMFAVLVPLSTVAAFAQTAAAPHAQTPPPHAAPAPHALVPAPADRVRSAATRATDAPPLEMTSVTVDLNALRATLGEVKAAAILRRDRPLAMPEMTAHALPPRDGTLLAMQASPTFAWQSRLESVQWTSTASEPMATVALAPGDVLAAVRTQAATRIDLGHGVSGVLSSTVLITPASPGAAQPLRQLGVEYRTAGMFWRAADARFEGELLIGIVDRNDAGAAEALVRPIPIQLLAAPGSLQRTDLQIQRIGLPYELVAVAADSPDDPFTVELLSQLDPNLPTARLPVKHPRVALSAPSELQGLGVEDATVTLSGIDARLPTGLPLVLDLDNGWLAEPTVVVGANGIASTRLRSTLLGSGTLKLAPGPFVAEPRVIAYAPPWPFLAAASLGSALGATVLALRKRRKPQRHPHNRWRDWVIGLFTGIGATAMAYAGMRLPEWVPIPAVLAGAVAPFALAFLCAAGGARLAAGFAASKDTP